MSTGTVDEITDAELDEVLSGADPEAPYGRFKNGKPRKRPPASAEIPSVPGPRRIPQRSASASSARKSGGADYAQLTKNVLQLPIMAASVAGQVLTAVGREQAGTAVTLDAMTVGLYSEQLGDVGARLAQADGNIARWLERFGKGGVYGEAFSLGAMMFAQFMVNHGRLSPMPAAGLVDPQTIYERAQAMAAGASDAVQGS